MEDLPKDEYWMMPGVWGKPWHTKIEPDSIVHVQDVGALKASYQKYKWSVKVKSASDAPPAFAAGYVFMVHDRERYPTDQAHAQLEKLIRAGTPDALLLELTITEVESANR